MKPNGWNRYALGDALHAGGSTPQRLDALAGICPAAVRAPGSVALSLPAVGHEVCAAGDLQ